MSNTNGIAKFWWIIPIVVIGLWYSSAKNNLVVESLNSNSPLFAATTVSATIYNDGAGKKFSYFIEKGNSDTKYCPGTLFFGANERRKINFQCQALTGYTGRFRLKLRT